jgi:hypothetical protein
MDVHNSWLSQQALDVIPNPGEGWELLAGGTERQLMREAK